MSKELYCIQLGLIIQLILATCLATSNNTAEVDDLPPAGSHLMSSMMSLCQNGGTLQVKGDDYYCACRHPYYGVYCEKKESPCPKCPEACKNNGVVQQYRRVMYCHCLGRYYGIHCEKECPSDFTLIRSPSVGYAVGCYKLILSEHSWLESSSMCSRFNPGAHLVAISDSEENEALKAYLRPIPFKVSYRCGPQTSIWTAGQRQTQGNCGTPFVWKTAGNQQTGLTFTDWEARQPDCTGNNEHCLSLAYDCAFRWNDLSCNDNACFICEMSA